jgi:hypothetical protein
MIEGKDGKIRIKNTKEGRRFQAHLRMCSDEVSRWPEWKVGSSSAWAELQETRMASRLPDSDRHLILNDLKSLIRTWVKNDVRPRPSEISDGVKRALMELVDEGIEPDADWRLSRRSEQ